MNTRKWLIASGTAILAALLLLILAAGLSRAQGSGPEQDIETPSDIAATPVQGRIPVQGQLTDDKGIPVADGYYSVRFSLHDALTGGNEVCADTNNVEVNDGLFYSEIWGTCTPSVIDGRQFYLEIEVESDGAMTPRQPIYPVPYAFSLRPGAIISGSTSAAILHIENWHASGRGLRVYAMDETGTNYGIVGASRSPNGYGGYFYNNSAGGGTGLRAWSEASVGLEGYSYETADYPGVFGCSADSSGTCDPYKDNNAAGVMGYSDNDWGGYFVGNDSSSGGVYGTSTQGEGVLGVSTSGYGVQAGSGNNHALYATSVLSDGVHALSLGDDGTGVYGEASNTSGGIGVEGLSEVGSGVYGRSAEGIGVYGSTGNVSNNYGLFTPDNLYSLNYSLRGAVMQVVQNGGRETLEPGDVVAFSGIGAPLEAGGLPTVQVVKATAADSTAVAGVVSSRYNIEAVTEGPKKANLEITPEGSVSPGEYLLVVIQGPAQVKASALAGALQPGDLLSSAGQAGYAGKATKMILGDVEAAMPGTVLGKVLEPLDEGEALIYIFVTLQ